MISLHRMSRLAETRDAPGLWSELSRSGIAWPLPLRVRLESVPAAAWALALRRLCELTHGPTALAQQLVRLLLDGQQHHGAWSRDTTADALVAHTDANTFKAAEGEIHLTAQLTGQNDPLPVGPDDALVTALAAAALQRVLQQPGSEQRPDVGALRHAHAAALAALAQMQHPADGLFGDPDAADPHHDVGRTPGRVAEACYVLFVLAEDAEALAQLRLLPLRDAVEAHAHRFDATLRETHEMANLLLDHAATESAGGTCNEPTLLAA